MYQENQFRTFNFWRDGDILHIFLTVPPNKEKQYNKTIKYVKKVLGLNFDLSLENNQFYFILSDFNEYKEFKTYFFRYLGCFA